MILDATDSLKKVPRSHRHLITPEISEAFADVPGHFQRVAARCPYPSMKAWLLALIEEDVWDLQLHQGDPKEWTSAGFCWYSSRVRGAEIAPARAKIMPTLPGELSRYYSLVHTVYWISWRYGGGLYGSNHPPLDDNRSRPGDLKLPGDIDPARSFSMGASPSGDMLIYTQDGRPLALS